jgi:hypothetical protein
MKKSFCVDRRVIITGASLLAPDPPETAIFIMLCPIHRRAPMTITHGGSDMRGPMQDA